jgi:hypothetical protein
MPVLDRTRSLVCEWKKHTSNVTTGTPKLFRHSLRDGVTAAS